MKKFISIILCLSLLFLVGCSYSEPNPNYVPQERPHLYWKDINVEIIDIDKHQYLAGTWHREVSMTVWSEEYQLEGKYSVSTSGIFVPSQWSYDEGDIVQAEMFSYVMDSTGEVVKREINQVY